ncbi:MAG: acyltransferase [Promethearchaeota archaeon]
MSEVYSLDLEKEISRTSKTNYFQVDFLKAVMIFLVIFDHMVSWNIKEDIGVALWERISIPVFLVIMGFNMGLSFKRKGDLTLRELYSWIYFKSKILRFLVPFFILYAVSTFIGLFIYGFDLSAMYHGQYNTKIPGKPNFGIINLFIGILPFWGPGNWFLPLIFQSILIMPLLYKAFTMKPILTLILCFIIEFMMQMVVFFFIGEFTSWKEVHYYYMFVTSILFYLSAVGLGMWFSFGYKLEDIRNLFIWFLFPISLAYLIAYQFFDFQFMIGDIPFLRGDYHFFVFPYSAFLFLLAMKFLPQKSDWRISRGISLIGKSTYHILLTQILGYGMIFAFWGTHYHVDDPFTPEQIVYLIAAWILFIPFGTIWYKIDKEKSILRRVLYYFNFFIVFASLLSLPFWIEGSWVPIPLIIIIIYTFIVLISKYIIKKTLNTKILGFWTLFLIVTFIMLVLQIEVLQPSEYWITSILIGAFLILAILVTLLDNTISLKDLRNIKWMWGFFFLFSAIFIMTISFWKFYVYLEHSHILLFQIWEYISLIYSIIITLVAIRAVFTTFYSAYKKLSIGILKQLF